MSRLTKQIRLVLISSSLILPGCQQKPAAGPGCERGPRDAKMPPACGPVGGRSTSSASGYHGGGYHGGGYHSWYFGNSSGYSGGHWGSSGGKAATFGSGRGGFGASAHGVGS